MTNNRVYLLMIIAAMFWSGAFVTGKIAVREFLPFALTFFRFLLALPFIFLILLKQQPDNWKPTQKEWPTFILLGFVGTFLYHVLFFFALTYTTAINSSLIGAANPMVTTLLAVIFFKENTNIKRGLGIVLSFLGVFLVATNGRWETIEGLDFNPGDIIMFIAVLCFATYMLLSKRKMDTLKISPLKVTAYTFLVCTLVAFPFFILEGPFAYIGQGSIAGWMSILYMAIFASVLGYLIQLISIERIGAPKTAIFINLVPVFTIVQSVIFLGENFTLFKFLSACLIILGVYLTTRPEKN